MAAEERWKDGRATIQPRVGHPLKVSLYELTFALYLIFCPRKQYPNLQQYLIGQEQYATDVPRPEAAHQTQRIIFIHTEARPWTRWSIGLNEQ